MSVLGGGVEFDVHFIREYVHQERIHFVKGKTMAIISTVADDFDGSTPAEAVRFSVAGRDYEIDLSKEHRAELDAIMAEFQDRLKKFTDVARPAGRAASTGRTPARRSSGSVSYTHLTLPTILLV